MGYGHLRAARALADAIGTEMLSVDRPPLADAGEEAAWRRTRENYERLSRGADLPFLGPAFRRALEALTDIPRLSAPGDLAVPDAASRMLLRLARRGLGRGLVEHLRATGRPLLTTFYAPAVIAAEAGIGDVRCVVTDVDVHRVWAPVEARATSIRYCVPTARTARRLLRYGVPEERIVRTGFPLPPSLLGGEDLPVLRANLGARLLRLDLEGRFLGGRRKEVEDALGPLPPPTGEAPLLVLAVGGAGAQSGAARSLLRAVRDAVATGRLRVALVAGTRSEVAASFAEETSALRLREGVEIVAAATFDAYAAAFEAVLARADVLWTKPSEMTFYAALGLPLLLAPPLGTHERCNRRWARERGAAFDARDPARAARDLASRLDSGALAAAAWNGFTSLPKLGTYRIART
jgi:hypothetical protein